MIPNQLPFSNHILLTMAAPGRYSEVIALESGATTEIAYSVVRSMSAHSTSTSSTRTNFRNSYIIGAGIGMILGLRAWHGRRDIISRYGNKVQQHQSETSSRPSPMGLAMMAAQSILQFTVEDSCGHARLACRWAKDMMRLIMKAGPRAALSMYVTDTNEIQAQSRDRAVFAMIPDPVLGDLKGHSHPAAAASRNSIMTMSLYFASSLGRKIYSYGASGPDQKSGLAGDRQYYWAKDLARTSQCDVITDDCVISLIDVDYHVDMNAFLLRSNPLPVLLYTFAPEDTAGEVLDGRFLFKDNLFCMDVAGGGVYKHELWDYGVDNITVSGWVMEDCVPVRLSITYLVERRNTSTHRQLILLSPISCHRGIASLLVSKYIKHNQLTRLKPRQGNWNVLRIVKTDESYYSVSQNGGDTSCRLSLPARDALKEFAKLCKAKKMLLANSDVESAMAKYPTKEKGISVATLIRSYIVDMEESGIIPRIMPVNMSLRTYQFKPNARLQCDGVPNSMQAYASAVLGPAAAPALTEANVKRAIEARITSVQTPEMLPTKFVLTAIQEFSERLVPQAHLGVPVDKFEVYERQNRPSQRSILEKAGLWVKYPKTYSSMIKREGGAKFGDPRIVTIVSPYAKAEYSRYMYAFSDAILKGKSWYAFGKKPSEIATKVAEICETASYVVAGDYSRMDGRVSNIGRLLTDACFLRYFALEEHDNIIRLLGEQRQKSIYLMGEIYDSLWSRLSGSPETSAFNTLENLFVCYLTKRMTMEADAAWASLATDFIVGGDDSLMAETPVSTYMQAAAMIGHVCTADVYKRGEAGVNFLARIFGPEVWYGDNNSMCDLTRALAKFHLALQMNGITPEQKLFEKSVSILMTDSNTPLIGAYARAVVQKLGGQRKIDQSTGDSSWWSHFGTENNFPNDVKEWYYPMAAKMLKLSPDDVARLHEWETEVSALPADRMTSVPMLLVDPIVQPAASVDIVCDELYEAPMSQVADIPVVPEPVVALISENGGVNAVPQAVPESQVSVARKPDAALPKAKKAHFKSKNELTARTGGKTTNVGPIAGAKAKGPRRGAKKA